MNGDLIFINQQLGKELEILVKKLDIAIVGLNAIISEGSDNLNIAEKTLNAIDDSNKKLPQEESENEQGAIQVGLYIVVGR